MGLGGSRGGSPVDRQLHQLPHAAALEHGLLRGARVEDGAEPKGGVVPGCAHLGTVVVGVFFFWGGFPAPGPRGEVELTWTVPSPRLCTTRRSPRRVSVQVSGRTLRWGDTEVAPCGDPPCAPGPAEADVLSGPCCVPKPATSPLPQHHPQARFSALHGSLLLRSGAPWGKKRGCGVVGDPTAGHPKERDPQPCSCFPPFSPCTPAPGRGQRAASPTPPHGATPVPPPQHF